MNGKWFQRRLSGQEILQPCQPFVPPELYVQKEKELFEARKTAKTANDKEFSDTKFRTELCNKVNVPHNRKMCRFAHGIEQLVCKTCYEVGHKKEDWTKQGKEVLSPVRGQ